MGLTLLTAPAVEPLSLAEAKAHCRVDSTDDDTLLTALIVTARRMAEQVTGRVLVTQSWRYSLDAFPCAALWLPYPPLVSVQSVKYLDGDGTLQTLVTDTDYTVHTSALLGLVVPAYGKTWPVPRIVPEAVRIEFTAGYGAAAAVPNDIKQWLLLQIGHWYDSRSAVGDDRREPLPFVDGLLSPYIANRF